MLADGTVIDTGTRARKSSAGYDPHAAAARLGGHAGRDHGADAVQWYPGGDRRRPLRLRRPRGRGGDGDGGHPADPAARCELLDPAAIRAVNAHDDLTEPEAYTLFLEFHGGPASVAEQVESVREIAAGHGGGDFGWTKTTDERNRLWRARHNAYFAVVATRPGTRAQTTDVCVPVSRLAESITASAEDAATLPFPAALVGHVADGNYHWICPVDTDLDEEQAAAGRLRGAHGHARAGGFMAPAMASTASGSASARRCWQAGPEAVATMRALGQALDPRGILNRGRSSRTPGSGGPPGHRQRPARDQEAAGGSEAGGAASSRSSSGRATSWPLPYQPLGQVERQRHDRLGLQPQPGVRAERAQPLERQRDTQ